MEWLWRFWIVQKMSACINPVSILITKAGDMRENSTSNDATRQWRQFAGRFCKLWSHVWNKDLSTFEMDKMDGLSEIRSMLRAKKKKKRYNTNKTFFFFFFYRLIFLPVKQTCHNWIVGITLHILTATALEAGRRSSLRAENIINIIIVWVLFLPFFSVNSKELYLHDGSSIDWIISIECEYANSCSNVRKYISYMQLCKLSLVIHSVIHPCIRSCIHLPY